MAGISGSAGAGTAVRAVIKTETFACDDSSIARFAMCCVRNRACELVRTGPVRSLRAGSFHSTAARRAPHMRRVQARKSLSAAALTGRAAVARVSRALQANLGHRNIQHTVALHRTGPGP